VSFEAPSGGGGTWGSITGTLSNQTDLQNALNAKYNNPTGTTSQYLRGDGSLATFPSLTGYVPYTGATQALNLGAFDLLVQGLTIGKGNNALVNNTALGHSTLLTVTTGNFNTAVGYESLRNTTTGQYNTAVGQSSLFSNTTGGQNTALGLNALLSNTTGSSNVAVGLDTLQHNTTGSSNTSIGYNAGSHITGGSTPNTTSGTSIYIGRDTKALADGQSNQIVIGYNAVGNGSNTATIGNSSITANYFTGSVNGGSFVKSGGTSSQFLKADGTVDSSVYVPTSRELTINGVTFDLSANRSWTVAGGISGSGASGQVAYWTGTSAQSGSNNLFWDNANGRLGIGTNVPATILDLKGNRATVSITDTTSGGANPTFFGAFTDFLQLAVNRNPSTGVYAQNTKASSQISLEGSVGSGSIRFYATNGNNVSPNELMRIYGTGNLLLQNGGTFTDSGERLQVTGTMKVTGATKIGNTVFADTSSNLIIGIEGSAARGAIANANQYQDFMFVNTSISSGNINSWSFGQRRDTLFGNTIGSFQLLGAYTSNAGAVNTVGGGYLVPLICNPNGDVLINGGSANVVNRYIGLGINAPTALTDIGASTTTRASLRIRSGTAPTSPNDGDIWFDGTDIKMRIGGVTKTFTLI
jgi:hypothetical protein